MEQKCNKCKSEWKSNITSAKCPFCGADMEEKKQHDMTAAEGVVAHIVENYGVDVLQNLSLFSSLFMDFSKDMERELRVLKLAINAGVPTLLLKTDKANETEKSEAKQKAIQKLCDDYMMEQAGAEKVVCWLAYALWGDTESTTQTDEATEDLYIRALEAYNQTDYNSAFPMFRMAAEKGHTWAQYCLAFCYEMGQGVAQSYADAARWYCKAADQGNDWAQERLGGLYYSGNGVAQSYTEAVNWYRKSAEQCNANAQKYLGDCYRYGYGVAQSYVEAAEWYQKAQVNGVDCKDVLEECYRNGAPRP